MTDAAWKLTYMQQRYYDPGIGRFLSVDPVTALSDPVGYFGRYHYAANNPYTFTDPDGRAWGLASKVVKVIVKGGDVASTVAGAVEDARTLVSRDATLGQRAMAFGSLVTEVASPVSARDVKAGVAAAENVARGGTYTLRNSDGTVVRTGRTNDLARREGEHGRAHPDTSFEVDRRTDDYATQRGREQVIHDQNPQARAENGGLNRQNPISDRNPRREEYMDAAKRVE